MNKFLLLAVISVGLIGCGGGGSDPGIDSGDAPVSTTPKASSVAAQASSVAAQVSSVAPQASSVAPQASSVAIVASSSPAVNSQATSSTASVMSAGLYLPIGANQRLTEDLLVVNKTQPTSKVVIEPSLGNSFITIPVADYSAASGITRITPAYGVYIKNGRLYKVDLRTTTGQPVAVLLSSETQAASRCVVSGFESSTALTSYNDYVAESSVVIYSALVGQSCVARAVSLGMSASNNPINLGSKLVLGAYLNTTNGRLAGFLVKDGAALKLVDMQFNVASTLVNSASDIQLVASSKKAALLMVDGGIRRFDFASKSLSSSLLTYPSTDINLMGASDAIAFYWSGPELTNAGAATANRAIYKLSDTAAPSLTKIYSTNQTRLQLFDLTSEAIIARNSDGFFSLNKSSNAITALNVPANAVILGSNANRFFYWNINVEHGSQSTFGSMDANNAKASVFANSAIVAVVDSTLGLNASDDADNFIVLQYADGATTMANAQLDLIDGSSGQKTATLGTLPAVDYSSTYFNKARFGVLGLCKKTTELCDAYFHGTTANSLVRLTNIVQ